MSFHRLTPEEIVNKKFTDTRVEYLALLTSFRVFYYRVFFKTTGQMPLYNSSHEKMLQYFQDVADLTYKRMNPNIKYLIQNTPQGSGKTTKIAYFIAWCILREPRSNFIIVSAVEKLSIPLVKNVHNLLFRPDNNSPLTYLQQICNIKRHSFSDGVLQIRSTLDLSQKDGTIRCMGCDGQITGYNGNIIGVKHFSGSVIIDDLSDASSSESFIASQANSILIAAGGRLRDEATGYIMAIGQRTSGGDVFSLIKERHSNAVHSFVIPLHTRFNTSSFPTQAKKPELIDHRNKAMSGKDMVTYFYNRQQLDNIPIVTHTTESLIERSQIAYDKPYYHRESFVSRLNNTRLYEKLGKIYSIDTSALKNGSDPTGMAEFVVLSKKTNNGQELEEYYLKNMFLFKYETFADIDRRRNNHSNEQTKPHYQMEFHRILESVIMKDYNNGETVVVLIENGVQSARLIGDLQYQFKNVDRIKIIARENNGSRLKSDGSAKYARFEMAMNWHGHDIDAPRFFIVRKDQQQINEMQTTNPNLYPHMVEVVERLGRQLGLAAVLKEQIKTINNNKKNDEVVDCISQTLLYAQELDNEVIK